MKPYEKYKESGVDEGDHHWIGVIPEHWQFVKLKQLVSCNDETLTIRDTDDFFINYIEIGDVNIEKGVDNYSNVHIQEAPSRARRIVKANDIIISTVRTYLKAIAKVPEEYNDFIASTGFAVLRAKAIDYNYLNFVVQNEDFINEVISLSVGASYPAISSNNLINIKVPLPSLEEQTAIANFLNHQTTLIVELIEKKTKQIALLKEKRQAIINETVSKGLDPTAKMKDSGIEWLGDIPENWEVIKLKWHLNFLNYKRIPIESGIRFERQGNYPYYGASGIIDYVDDYIFEGKYILIGEDGANILSRSTPLAFIAEGKFWVNNHAHILEVLEGNVDYFCYQIESNDFAPLATGSAQPKLTKDAVANIKVIVPPLIEQNVIVDFINNCSSSIDSIVDKIYTQIEKLKEYRQSLISEAVTGKIDVRGWQKN